MKNMLTRLWKEEEGQDLTEYGLLLLFIALVSIAVVRAWDPLYITSSATRLPACRNARGECFAGSRRRVSPWPR